MIPDFQTLMRPVLECASHGEVYIGNVVEDLAQKFDLTNDERNELLPSGKQDRFSNRVNWAKSYLKQAGLVIPTKRGYFTITSQGKAALNSGKDINNSYLKQFVEFQEFQSRTKEYEEILIGGSSANLIPESNATPDEVLREAHKKINATLSADLLDRLRSSSPAFFEHVIVSLLLAMGYGGTSEQAGRALGRSGDDGVDGVIDQDPLGVDQIYVQAKRYADGNNISSGALREFFGALSLKKAQKGIFVTTSAFTPSAIDTAKGLGMRIVLIDGVELTRLMLRYNIGCRNEDTLYLKKIDEDFFEWGGD